MAGTDEPEVKDVDRVEITPAGEGEETVDAEETAADSSQQETEGEEDDSKPDEIVRHPKKAETEDKSEESDEEDGLKEVDGETTTERALRLELTRVRGKLRQERKDDLLGDTKPATKKTELTAEENAVISKYKPEEISALREVMPALAKEMGFVRKDELEGSTYSERSQEQLDTFLEKHPEYLPDNDKDGILWNAFKAEFGYYKTPTNPKDFTKIFERIHRDVFGIKPKGALSTVNAQREKAKVSSHAGSSSAPAAPKAKPAKANSNELRLDMLKGFSDEEKAELLGEDE